MDKKNLLSIIIPSFSVLILVSFLYFTGPTITGLAVYSSNETSKQVNADMILITKSGEVIPPNAVIEAWIDNRKAGMSVQEFIEKTKLPYEVKQGALEDFGFYGMGYTGDHIYNLTLADFNLNREIGTGDHTFKTRIVYRTHVLYEKENKIIINE